MLSKPSHLDPRGSSRERLLRLGRRFVRRVTIPLRRAYYVEQPYWTRLVSALPGRARKRIGLDDVRAVGSRRLELGAGPHPQAGYIHLDVDWGSNHLEGIAPAWNLPFPDGWAQELVAIHMFEHIHPRDVARTLAEWRRVLAPGGQVRIHVPNAGGLMERFLTVAPPDKWRFINALLGMYGGPETSSPQQIASAADHQLLLDWPLMQSLFEESGFIDVEDVSSTVRDRHTDGWAHLIDQMSLVVAARNPAVEA